MGINVADSMKAIAAIVVSAAGALIVGLSGFGSDANLWDLDAKTWLIALASVLGSGGIVWWVENVKGVGGTIIKTVVGFLSAGVASLVVALDDHHITQAEWLVAFSAAALATGLVYQAKGPAPTEPETAVVAPVAATTRARTPR